MAIKLSSLDEDFKRMGLAVPAKKKTPAAAADPAVADLTVHRVVAGLKKSLEGAELLPEQIEQIVQAASKLAVEAKHPAAAAAAKVSLKKYGKVTAMVGRMGRKFAKGGVQGAFHTLYDKAKGKLGAAVKGNARPPMHGESTGIEKLMGDLQDVLGASRVAQGTLTAESAAFANLAISADLLARALVPIQNAVAECIAAEAFNEDEDGPGRDALVEMSETVQAMAELAADFAQSLRGVALSEEDSTDLEEVFGEMLGLFMVALEMFDEYQEDMAILEADDDEKDEDDDDEEDPKRAKSKKKDDDDEDDKKGKKPPFGKASAGA